MKRFTAGEFMQSISGLVPHCEIFVFFKSFHLIGKIFL